MRITIFWSNWRHMAEAQPSHTLIGFGNLLLAQWSFWGGVQWPLPEEALHVCISSAFLEPSSLFIPYVGLGRWGGWGHSWYWSSGEKEVTLQAWEVPFLLVFHSSLGRIAHPALLCTPLSSSGSHVRVERQWAISVPSSWFPLLFPPHQKLSSVNQCRRCLCPVLNIQLCILSTISLP